MTWRMRASVAAAANAPYGDVGGCTALMIDPKSLLLRLETGFAKFTWFSTLYAFAPSVKVNLSVRWKLFFSPRSVLKYPGPRKEFRGIVPKLVTAGPLAKSAAVKHGLLTLDPPQRRQDRSC